MAHPPLQTFSPSGLTNLASACGYLSGGRRVAVFRFFADASMAGRLLTADGGCGAPGDSVVTVLTSATESGPLDAPTWLTCAG